jgi:hypothetical protein
MTAYRILWRGIFAPLGVIGTVVALAASPAAVACSIVVFGLVGSLLVVCADRAYWAHDTRGRLRLLVGGALLAGTSVGAFIGYASLLGPGVLLLTAVAVASSPYIVTTSRECLRSVRARSTTRQDVGGPALPFVNPPTFSATQLRDLTDGQLCKRWRASHRATQWHSSAVKLIAAAAERQMYLDELERRNSSGFAAWLAAGPQRADDPLPYLTGHHTDAQAIDWDELTRGRS